MSSWNSTARKIGTGHQRRFCRPPVAVVQRGKSRLNSRTMVASRTKTSLSRRRWRNASTTPTTMRLLPEKHILPSLAPEVAAGPVAGKAAAQAVVQAAKVLMAVTVAAADPAAAALVAVLITLCPTQTRMLGGNSEAIRARAVPCAGFTAMLTLPKPRQRSPIPGYPRQPLAGRRSPPHAGLARSSRRCACRVRSLSTGPILTTPGIGAHRWADGKQEQRSC